jgi:precorrin-2 dehydrogenase / sirohydrochlorin ferrochelatase
MSYYPVLLALAGRRCLVIGGGSIAEGKVAGLLEAEATITVVAPALSPALRELAVAGRIAHVPREYQPGDLDGAFLAIAAADDRAVNGLVWQEATQRNVLLNAVDDVPHCSFIAPAIVRRGDLIVSISTSGVAPALAVRLKEKLERELGPEYERFLLLARGWRARLAAGIHGFEQRKARWYELVDSNVLSLLRGGDEAAVQARAADIIERT